MLVGSRVVRGPNWKFEDQDGGEGFVGTITSIEHFEDGSPLPKGTVLVYWDTGIHGSYRAGQDGCYDLRILDSAPAGVKFSSYSCDGCNQGIAGMRLQCTVCHDFHLCTLCYMDDKHDRSHVFTRFDASNDNDNGVIVGQRSTCAKIQAKGIFSLATVKTGNDWALEPLGNGIVLELDSWEGVARSAAMVSWDNFCELLLRVGYEGKVDLKLVTPSSGPSYYEGHLPTVSLDDISSLKKQQNMGSTIPSNENEGQRKNLQQELIQRLQSQQSDNTRTTPVKSPPPRTLPKPLPRSRNNNSKSSNVGEAAQAKQGQATTEPITKVRDLIKWMSQADMAESGGRTPVKAKAPAPPPPANRVDPSEATVPKTSKKTRPAPPPPRPRSAILAGSDNIAPEKKETKAAPSRTHVASLRESLGNALQLDPTRSRLPQTKKPPARELICTSCDEMKASKVVFEPCGDFVDVYCLGCARKLKRCLKCNEPINNKMTPDGSQLPDNDSDMGSSDNEKVKELERQLAEVTRQIECPICMDEQSNVLFGCGHKTCWDCSELIRQDNNHCPICKQHIDKRNRMF